MSKFNCLAVVIAWLVAAQPSFADNREKVIGTWKLISHGIADKPVRGYFALTLVREGDGFKYRYDVFNVASVPSEQQAAPQK
jgi:hypothetical protein